VAQQEIEVILMRELASYLATPIFLVDPEGTLLFYNDPAEILLGSRFEETGPMPLEDWSRVFEPADAAGDRVELEDLPLVIAVRERRPAHAKLGIRGLDGAMRTLQVTALPLESPGGRVLGAAAIFWEAAPK
jgi:PAS domain-containing protein